MGQHRKKGQKGGSGNTGLKKHKWIWTVKYAPDYFGKHGFVRKNQTKNREINLRDVSNLASEHSLSDINLKDFGYDKVLGMGQLKSPLTITAAFFSKRALEKIQEAGGRAITPQ